MAHEPENEQGSGRGLAVETAKPEVARPPLFQVLLLNDDFTPMDFVVEVLRGFFNLDQEQVIYRADPFVPSGFARLQRAFNGLNLGVVSVETLQKRNEWPQMLARLANEQLAAKPPPDAVIILGRSFRWVRKTPSEMLMYPYPGMPGFFYFENGPQNLFLDSLGLLASSVDGQVYRINTPHDLASAIQKMLAQLPPDLDQLMESGSEGAAPNL